MTPLEMNIDYVKNNRAHLIAMYPEKYILVLNEAVVNSFDDYESAANYAIENFNMDAGFYIEYMGMEEPINLVFACSTH